jgi:hypothetical protein
VPLHFTDGPLDVLLVDVDAHSAGHPIIGWATITRTGCVAAEYRGEPGSTARRVAGYQRPEGRMVPWWAERQREAM